MSNMETRTLDQTGSIDFGQFRQMVLADFKLACVSREMSLLGRKEVLTGKAKFGIFGDGKEVAQIALARHFRPGDWRSGYYRDQTWMMALGLLSPQQFFAQLYAHTDPLAEPMSAGRQMNGHFATAFTDENGDWLELKSLYNSSADASPTAGQMPRSLGLALASKIYRKQADEAADQRFSNHGNEISFVSIGDASTSEGLFWETINAAGVMQVPLAVSVWDDGYGISVSREFQTTKDSISEALRGMQATDGSPGLDIYVCEGWNYPALMETYRAGTEKMRSEHTPALFHIIEVTQPQGHSTSGSHERYKSAGRLEWEKSADCILRMQEWMLSNGLATADETEQIRAEAKAEVATAKKQAWEAFSLPIREKRILITDLLQQAAAEFPENNMLSEALSELKASIDPGRKELLQAARKAKLALRFYLDSAPVAAICLFASELESEGREAYNTFLHNPNKSALNVPVCRPRFYEDSPLLNGYEILNQYFDQLFSSRNDVIAFGEDVGKIGDVNQGFAGLQEKHGDNRIFDTGIREATIVGQAIGLSMRGYRPIAEIQYLDYLLYGLEPLSDDVACLHYRTAGKQQAPLIIRTRGHRLEGIWHTGSPMGMIIHALRGIYVCVPRNMVQAAGMYNTLLRSQEPGLVVECLNGYRLKEQKPENLLDFTVALGEPEVLIEGEDVTLVTYGSCVRIAEEACKVLEQLGIGVELIDLQTLLPFDLNHRIVDSVKKTSRLLILDEDVPGGASAFIYQQLMEIQSAFRWLDAEPITLTARDHRAAYGSDGDYFCKPSAEDVVEAVYRLMHDADPASFPALS